MMKENPKPPKLNRATHGVEKILDISAVDRILTATGLPLQPGYTPAFVEVHLNELLYFSISRRLFPDYDIKTLRQLKSHYLKFFQLSQKLQSSRCSPPLPPHEWHRKTMTWLEEMEQGKAKRGRPRDACSRYFLPRALGLYAAVFDATPTPTVGKSNSDHGNSTARFISASITEAGRYIDRIGIDESYTPKQMAQIRWHAPTGATLEKQLEIGLEIITEDRRQRVQRPAWQIFAEFYASPAARR